MSHKRKVSLKYQLLNLLVWLLNEGYDCWEVATSKHYVIKGRRGYNRRNFLLTISEMEKIGYIEKTVGKKGVFLRLLSDGERRLAKEIPLPFLAKKKWDGIFRGIAFDIPEKKKSLRKALRNHLRNLGFGLLQLSFWITPYPLTEELEEFIESRGLSPYALVIKTKRLEIEEAKKLAKRVWQLEKIAQKYEEFIEKWQERLDKEKDLSKIVGELRNEFFELLRIDPCLPIDLLPEDWPKQEAKKIFLRLEKVS